ncbi:peptide-methionine (R)-S-oxide reductase MsrB [Dyadobacter sp. CY345]|nr:peptide-methionine (R)-S-oxide reductase MsrB [Dyadobacter sp. CY345]
MNRCFNFKSKKMREIAKSEEEWQKELTGMQCFVLREKGTERPFTSPLNDNKEEGTYVCAACDTPLFSSETKYESGSGWPSFFTPIGEQSVEEIVDNSHGMSRTEVVCRTCGGHLGHVFNDGPKPTGLRYCMNGVALKFIKAA